MTKNLFPMEFTNIVRTLWERHVIDEDWVESMCNSCVTKSGEICECDCVLDRVDKENECASCLHKIDVLHTSNIQGRKF